MKQLFFLFIPLFFIGKKLPDDCGGTYRWDYKILIDTAGLKVFPKAATPRTIHTLVNITRPPNSDLGNKRSANEKKKVTVTAFLVGLGKEDDADFHLILTGTNFKDSLIAEIPDPSCDRLDHFPGLRDAYTKARTFIEENIDATPGGIHYLATPVKVKVTGVLFFDKMAHGNGHARNGIEIHPVLKITKAG